MFLVRFLIFSLAMFFSHLQADEFNKRPSCDDDDHTIKTHIAVAPKHTISHLASLKLANKEVIPAFNNHDNRDGDNLNEDNKHNDTKRKSYHHITILSPHFDQLKNIAADFKEKMRRLKDRIIGDDDYEPRLLPIGSDNRPERKQTTEIDENLLPQKYASEVKTAGSYTGSKITVGPTITTKPDIRINGDTKLRYQNSSEYSRGGSLDSFIQAQDMSQKMWEIRMRKLAATEAQYERQDRDILLATHNYVFKPSAQAQQQLLDAQNAIQKEQADEAQRNFLESLWNVGSSAHYEKVKLIAQENIARERKIWEELLIPKLIDLENAQTNLLNAYGYFFKPSQKVEQELDNIQRIIADETSLFGFLRFKAYPDYFDHKKELERVALVNYRNEQRIWKAQSLQKVAQENSRIEKEKIERALEEKAQVEKENTNRALRAAILKEERIKIRAEKEAQRELIIKLKKDERVKQLESPAEKEKLVQSLQWGDNFPMIKNLFSYLDWRKEENSIKNSHTTLPDNSKTQTPGNSNSNSLHNSRGNDKGPKKNNDANEKYHQLDDKIINGKKFQHYLIIDKKSQCIIGEQTIPYDSSSIGDMTFYYHKPIPIKDKSNTQLQALATHHEQYRNQERAKANAERTNQIQQFIKGSGYKKIDQINLAEKQVINDQLQKWGIICSDISTIELGAQGKQPTISYAHGKQLITIGIQPNGCIYPISQVDLPPTTPYQASPLLPAPNTSPTTSLNQPKIAPLNLIPIKAPDAIHEITPPIITGNEGEIPDKPNPGPRPLPTPEPTPTPDNPTGPQRPDRLDNFFASNSGWSSFHTNDSEKSTQSEKSIDNPKTTKKPVIHRNEIPEETQAQKRRKQLIEEQDSWMQNTDLSTASPEEHSMIKYMQDCMVDAQNDTVVEFAQAGLQSWTKAQQAQSGEEHDYHIKKSKELYDAMQNKTPLQSIAQQAKPIAAAEVDNLLQDYTTAIKMQSEEQDFNRPHGNSQHFDRLEKRAQALAESKEQIHTNTLPHRTYEVSPQARGFMMANNINYAAFDGTPQVTNFQHCLTQEILGIVESSANTVQNYDSKSIIGQLATYNCNLAVAAQQLNQLARVEQAVAVLDISHFFSLYTKFTINNDIQAQAWKDIGAGTYDGTAHALQKWGNFLKELNDQPRQTIGKMTNDLKTIATSLYKIVGQACEASPHAYLNDTTRDMLDGLAAIKNRDGVAPDQNQSSRMMQRTERNAQALQDGLYGAVQAAQVVIDEMMKKSLRENVADITEIGVDSFITGKVTDGLMKIAEIVGTPILHAAEKFAEAIPSNLQDSHPIFMPNVNTGELFAIADTTGESIGAATAAKKSADELQNAIKKIIQGKQLSDTAKNGSGNNSGDSKQKVKSADSYTYKNGKYNNDTYHSSKGSKVKSPGPKDGQGALDRSFDVKNATQRITTENNKIVILQYEGNGVYHGYIVEDFFSIKNESVQHALVEKGLVNSMKGGKVIKS